MNSMAKDKNLIERIGIDKSIIGNIKVISVDFDILLQKKDSGAVTLHTESERDAYYILENGEMFSYLKIRDNNKFGDFVAGIKISKGSNKIYAKMSITNNCNNLQNLSCEEYRNKLDEIFSYLESEYGIKTDYSDARFCQLEINATFQLKHGNFKDYRRVLLMFARNVPSSKYARKSKKKGNRVKDSSRNKLIYCTFYEADKQLQEDRLQTLYVGNNDIELKIYDKGEQMNNAFGLKLPSNIIRIEFTLKSERKIRSAVISTDVSDITDKRLKTFFVKQFTEDILRQYALWHKANQKSLSKLVKEHFDSVDKRMWIPNLLRDVRCYESIHNIPLLFDIDDLINPIKDITNNHSRTFSNIKSEASKHEQDLIGNHEKLNEIRCKVLELGDTI